MSHRWQFLKRYIADPTCVGAVAPSSPALAKALCRQFHCRHKPATVLEVGAGTGAVTRHLTAMLGTRDRLDICEIEPSFADILERTVLSQADVAPAVDAGRIRLFREPLQALDHPATYDFVISGLPLTAFDVRDVIDVFRVIRRNLKPGGVLSYFEYVGLRRVNRTLAVGTQRRRIRFVSAFLTRTIRRHQFALDTIFGNVPPAYARHLRFDSRNGEQAAG